MVKLGIATGSRGTGGESTSHSGIPLVNQHLYSYQVIRSEGDSPHMPQQFTITPSTSSSLQLETRIESRLPADTRISPIRHRNEVSLSAPGVSPAASSSSGTSSSVSISSRSHMLGWPKSGRELGESVIRSQKRPHRETEDPPEIYEKYPKEVKWCPLCRSPIHSGVVHHCPATAQQSVSLYPHSGTQDKGFDKYSTSGTDSYTSSHTPSYSDDACYSAAVPEEGLNFSLGRSSGLRVPAPSGSPLSISPGSSHSQTIRYEDHSPSTSSSVLKHTASVSNSRHTHPPRSLSPVISLSQPSTSHQRSSSSDAQEPTARWVEDSNYNQASASTSDSWETPTSLISRLTAGLTSRSSPQDDKGGRGCPSPTISETSSVSMSSSYFSHQEFAPPVNPFNMAHQELLEEFSKHTPAPVVQRSVVKSNLQGNSKDQTSQKRGRRYTSSESTSSDIIQASDAGMYGSQDLDTEDSCFSNYLDDNGKLPDMDTLLKNIRQPELSPYSSDKVSVDKFLEPHEIGHINHLMKSVTDAMLTISLAETKSKGFTPLDYIDIHLNSVIRHFVFVFKNEDFMNLTIKDKIALLDGCTLRAIQCTSLYLFNKEAGFWHIRGAPNKANNPVIHVSDLKKVFPPAFVARTYDLHCAASNLAFDCYMGVIASCILMYTPLNTSVQELDKVDLLRDKYVHLLLKYITWKHGTYNASLLFPEILKLLDAVLVHVEELASITLKLNEEEVTAVKEKLETLTLSHMTPYGCQSSKFKEKVASWAEMECVKLGDIQKRLCLAMVETLQSANTHQFTNTIYYRSGSPGEEQIITTYKPLPQLMPASGTDYSEEWALERSSTYLNERIAQQNREMRSISALVPKDLMMLRRFLEEVTNREGTLVVQNIKEKMDSNQIKKIISKLCS